MGACLWFFFMFIYYIFLHEAKAHKISVWERIKQCEKDLMFQKTGVFILCK